MPSDSRVQPALGALRRQIAAYRSLVAGTRERARTLLATGTGADRARLELGSFGAARIDATRFGELRRGFTLDALSRGRLEQAHAVLAEIDGAKDEIFTVDVPPGDSLRVVIAHALANCGRAFGAAGVAELVRTGRYEPERHDRMLAAYPFEWWSTAERAHAPPVVATVDGADLRAGSLAELLDGGMHIVLLVHGPSTPAPLVRLVTPGTLVVQAREATALQQLAEFEGPSIAALFEQEAAHFVHNPRAGTALWQRLAMGGLPASQSKKGISGVSARQQREELAQLAALAERPAVPNGSVEALVPAGIGDPTDRLTAWLLGASGLATGS